MAAFDRHPGIRPQQTLRRRLDVIARHAFPTGSTVLAMLVIELPLRLPGQAEMLPAVAFICVWFWSVFRPVGMPPPAVFLIGLLLDLRGYLPLGSGVLTLLLIHGVALRYRRFLLQQGFALIWLVFVCVATGGAALIWLLTGALTLRLLSPVPMLIQAALTIALYPLLAWPMSRAHATIADPDQA